VEQHALDNPHRNKDGKISVKLGDTTIWTLRKTYGEKFAPDEDENAKLGDVLERLDEPSLSKLIQDLPENER
jgi:hypothetical protein